MGFPLSLWIVYPKYELRTSISPLSQATSIACRIALSTLEGVVWNVLATCGYNTLVMALACLQPAWGLPGWGLWNLLEQQILWVHLLLYQLPISLLVCWAYPNDNKIKFFSQVWRQQTSEKSFFGTNQTKSDSKNQWTLWNKQ